LRTLHAAEMLWPACMTRERTYSDLAKAHLAENGLVVARAVCVAAGTVSSSN
jgi:hypothetical protein